MPRGTGDSFEIREVHTMTTAKRTRIRTLDQCMDVFDWFSDDRYEYIYHIWLSKSDSDARLTRALPELIRAARELIRTHRGHEDAYPEYLLPEQAPESGRAS